MKTFETRIVEKEYDEMHIRIGKDRKFILFMPEFIYPEDIERLIAFIKLIEPSQRLLEPPKPDTQPKQGD